MIRSVNPKNKKRSDLLAFLSIDVNPCGY